MLKSERPKMTITRRMRFACWITKATNILSEYVIVVAPRRRKWFHERVSVLRYTCTASLFVNTGHEEVNITYSNV